MIFTVNIDSTMEELARAQLEVEHFLATADVPAESAYVVRLCLEELVSNVIRHGHSDRARHHISLTVDVDPDGIGITVEDDGQAFDPRAGDELQAPASLDRAPTGGMGLPLVRAMAESIDYARRDGRNLVSVRVAV